MNFPKVSEWSPLDLRMERAKCSTSLDTCRNCLLHGEDGEHLTECSKVGKSELCGRDTPRSQQDIGDICQNAME